MCTLYADTKDNSQYINLMEEAQRKDTRGNLLVTKHTMVPSASTSILATKDFEMNTKKWDELLESTKTWDAWRVN